MRDQPYRYALGDEAGETGFRFGQGSTTFFVYSILLVDDLQPLREYIDEMRDRLGVAGLEEFKFHNSSDANRRAFLHGLRALDFTVRALAINKSRLPLCFHQMGKLDFFAFVLNDLIRRIPAAELGQTYLILDRFDGVEKTVRLLRRQLRASSRPDSIGKIAARRSRGENALQVADMVAGAILRSARTGDHSWYRPIWEKVLLWEYEYDENPPS
jgi:hypothetical protein